MIDLVFPEDNEKDFKGLAEKLGLDLYFVYDSFKKDSGVLATIANIRKHRKSNLVLIRNPKDVRATIENSKPDIIFEAEKTGRADYLHQRNSGLNHIICRAAKEKGVAIGFSTSLLLSNSSRIIGRMNQNIKLCRKFKVPMVIASFTGDPYIMRAPQDIKSLFVTIGMHPNEAERAMLETGNIIERNKKRQDMVDGAEILR